MPPNSYTLWNKAKWTDYLVETNFVAVSNKRAPYILAAFKYKGTGDNKADAKDLVLQIKMKIEKKISESKEFTNVLGNQNDETERLLEAYNIEKELSKEKETKDEKDIEKHDIYGSDDDDSDEESVLSGAIESEKLSGVEESKVELAESSDEEEDKSLTENMKISAKERKKKTKSKEKDDKGLFSTKTVTTKDTKTSVSTTWDVSSLVSEITDASFDDFDTDLTGCEYEGFDPVRTLTILAAHAEADNLKYKEFVSDMKFLAPFIAMRGTNKKSIVERTREDKRPIIETLLKRYKVVDNGNKGGFVSKDTIILSRIVSCFPVYVSMALSARKIEAKCKTDGLPLYLHHSAGASLIPKSDTATYNLWLTWSKAHDKLINGKDADGKKVEQFGKIVHESNNVEDDKRAQLSKVFSDHEKSIKANDPDSDKSSDKE